MKNIYIYALVAIVVIAGVVWFVLQDTETEQIPEYKEEVTIKDSELDTVDPLEMLRKAKEIEYIRYDSEMTFPGGERTSKVWISGTNMRMEVETQGQEVVILIDESTGEATFYMPTEGFATKMNIRESEMGQEKSMIDHTIELLGSDYKVVGTERVDGKNCLVVEYEDEFSSGTMWIWTTYGLPIKMEIQTSEGTTTVIAKNINFSSFSEDVFQLPAGIQVTDMADFQ